MPVELHVDLSVDGDLVLLTQTVLPLEGKTLPAQVSYAMPLRHPQKRFDPPPLIYREVTVDGAAFTPSSSADSPAQIRPTDPTRLTISYQLETTPFGRISPLGSLGGEVDVKEIVVEKEPPGWRCIHEAQTRTYVYDPCERVGNLVTGPQYVRGLIWQAPDADQTPNRSSTSS